LLLQIAAIVALLAGTPAPTTALPQRPPDGTYTYALSDKTGATAFTSSVVVKSNGATFDVRESVKLPNGQAATTDTTWDSAKLLPLNYTVQQGTIDLSAVITPSSAVFTGHPLTKPLTFTALPGTNYMLVYEGLNAFRLMVPFVIAAHPGQSFTIAHINGNVTDKGQSITATAPQGGKPGDTVLAVTLGDERIFIWQNPTTGIADEFRPSPGEGTVKLVQYTPPAQ
jgi:hypothetical protein